MPLSVEEKREYNKKYYENNKQKYKEKQKKYNEANKEKIKQQKKEYYETEKGIKSHMISRWREQGMRCDDWDSLYEIYRDTWKCDFCLDDIDETVNKHLDHNHDPPYEVRGILCRSCNRLDVLNY